jgi:hypothetical protein
MEYIIDSCKKRRGCSITYDPLPHDGGINSIHSEVISATNDFTKVLPLVSTITYYEQSKKRKAMAKTKPSTKKPGTKKPGTKKGC